MLISNCGLNSTHIIYTQARMLLQPVYKIVINLSICAYKAGRSTRLQNTLWYCSVVRNQLNKPAYSAPKLRIKIPFNERKCKMRPSLFLDKCNRILFSVSCSASRFSRVFIA